MADYSKATNFTAKDTLPTGNAGKIVKGTEIDTELTAIASAIASKANINSPTFTGTPAAPTASIATNTTQLASTAFVQAVITDLALSTMSKQAKTAVDITGGTIVGITDLAVADGGTGRSTLTDKAVLIGAGTGGITSVSPGTSGNVLKSDGTNWTSAAVSTVAGLGLNGETWQNVAGSRAVSSTYTNGETYPIQIIVTLVNTSGAWLYINGNLVIRQFYDVNTGAGQTGYSYVTAIIPAGSTYQVTGGNLSTWYELR